jgi:hypothetical protein
LQAYKDGTLFTEAQTKQQQTKKIQ